MARGWSGAKDLSVTYGIAAVLIVGSLFAAYQFVDPAPPREIILATGEAEGAYQSFGARYVDVLSRHGISVQLKSTAGSVENLELLAGDTGVHLAGTRVTVGAEGSGVRAIGMTLLAANGVDASNARLLDLPHAEAIVALANEDVDAAFVVASPESDVIRRMIRLPGVHLYDFEREAAYARLYPFLSPVSLPEGVMDLAANLPASDVTTIAPTAMLAARKDLHPALIDLLLAAADEIHGDSSLLSDQGQFPTAQYADLPISEEATR